jgi:RimJ/RimL family protein N-acetyltransferase
MSIQAPLALTPRLSLVLLPGEHMLALLQGVEPFERVSGLRVADGARDFFGGSGEISPVFMAKLRAWTKPSAWDDGIVAVHREIGLVIGSCGFKGAPDPSGMVEIAYGVIPPFRGQGYATEMANGLIDFASRDPAVQVIRAHTMEQTNASTRVLERCRFTARGAVIDPEDGEVWRWERPAR